MTVWRTIRSWVAWLYVATVSRHFILGRTEENRGTRAGFYPAIWVICAMIALLFLWVIGGFHHYTATDLQLWLVCITATVLTYVLTRGIDTDREVHMAAQSLDNGPVMPRNMMRIKALIFYCILVAFIYLTLTEAVFLPQFVSG